MYIILAILAFGILIIVHELGHFALAKLNGIRVEEFSIGMGPRILSKQGKETRYSLSLFPIGGYVKMMGEEEIVEDERSFSAKSPLRRISVIIAGAAMNYLLAILIFTFYIHSNGYALPIVGEVKSSTPAYEAGLQVGDEFLRINNSKVFSKDDVSAGVLLGKDSPVNMLIDRNGEKKEVVLTPEKKESGNYEIGIIFQSNQNPSFMTSFKESFKETTTLISQTFKALKMMVTGKANFKQDVGGPITIIKMSAHTAKAGIWPLLYFTAFISVNLAVMNLLPIPALDGGWCVILLIELITRRKVPDKVVGTLNYIGFAALMALMVIVTIKDIVFPIKV